MKKGWKETGGMTEEGRGKREWNRGSHLRTKVINHLQWMAEGFLSSLLSTSCLSSIPSQNLSYRVSDWLNSEQLNQAQQQLSEQMLYIMQGKGMQEGRDEWMIEKRKEERREEKGWTTVTYFFLSVSVCLFTSRSGSPVINLPIPIKRPSFSPDWKLFKLFSHVFIICSSLIHLLSRTILLSVSEPFYKSIYSWLEKEEKISTQFPRRWESHKLDSITSVICNSCLT